MNETITENKMGVALVWSLLLTMSLPVILSTAVQALYNIVDGIFVAMISIIGSDPISYIKAEKSRQPQKAACFFLLL